MAAEGVVEANAVFDHAHYVPVLRWKPGERWALKVLSVADRVVLTPIIEPLPGYMRRRGQEADDLSCVVDQLAERAGAAPVFVDLARVVGTAFRGRVTHSLESFFGALGEAGVRAIPVTSPDQRDSFQAAIRDVQTVSHAGAGVRIPASLIRTGRASRELRALMARLSVELAEVDIIVEYGLVDGAQPPFSYICHRLPEVVYSRTFTVLAGSFPPDLTGLRGPAQYELPRLEWTSWSTEIARPDDPPRRPSFGDYTVQHPAYREPVENANVSASIRYASDDYWVVMRGEALRKPGSPGYAQYVGNAQLLCQRKEFSGPQFSAGDDYVWKIASRKDPRFGNPLTWIRAGINHHLVFAARQVQSVVSAAV